MHPLRYPLLADENIHEEVVLFLQRQGIKITSIWIENLRGSSDEQIVIKAAAEQRIILTHDADFGRILFVNQPRHLGIIYLRPDHLNYVETIQTLQSVLNMELHAHNPFILVLNGQAATSN